MIMKQLNQPQTNDKYIKGNMTEVNTKENNKDINNVTSNAADTEILKMQCALDNAIMEDSFGILYQKEFQEFAKCFEPK